VKLGTGGLIRAYGSAAKEGILATGIIERVLYSKVDVIIDYSWYGKVENEMNSRGYNIIDANFLNEVTATILVEVGGEREFEALIMDLTSGQVSITIKDAVYVEKEMF